MPAALEDAYVPGLVHVNLDRYHRRDIESVNALDVYEQKTARERVEASIRGDDAETPTGQVVPAGAGAAATAVPVPEEAARAIA